MDFDEVEQLCKISLKRRKDAVLTMPMSDLLNNSHLSSLFDFYMPSLQTLNPEVVAVSLSRWLGFVAIGLQYFMSVQNLQLDLSIDNISVEVYPAPRGSGFWLSFFLHKWLEIEAPTDCAERRVWCIQVLGQFYGQTIRPVLEALAANSGIGVGQLWGQFPQKLIWFTETIAREYDPRIRQSVVDEYDCLKNEIDPSVFGRKNNPFTVKLRWIESLEDASKQVYVYPACCLCHATENGKYCYTCPRLTEKERAIQGAEFRVNPQ